MKKNSILFAILSIATACGPEKAPDTNTLIAQENVEGLRAKQAELVKQNNVIKQELNLVIDAIDRLDKDKKRALITVLSVKETPFSHSVVLQGIVKTDQNMMLNAEFMGTVKSIHVTEGQEVKKGDLLVTIHDGGLAQNVALQKVQLDLAETIYARQKRLWDQKIGAEIDYLKAKTAYESQQNAYNQLKEQLGKTTLYAPFSGRIDDIVAEVGQLVTPGASPLLRLVNLDKVYIETDVPEKYFTRIHRGTTAEVEISVFDHHFKSSVVHKGTNISTGNRTFKVSVAADKTQKLAPNLITNLKLIEYENPKALVIPLEIVSENFAGEHYVYVVNDDNKAEKRKIKTGLVEGDMVEVLEGLNPQDRVIFEGARLVKENENVQITNTL